MNFLELAKHLHKTLNVFVRILTTNNLVICTYPSFNQKCDLIFTDPNLNQQISLKLSQKIPFTLTYSSQIFAGFCLDQYQIILGPFESLVSTHNNVNPEEYLDFIYQLLTEGLDDPLLGNLENIDHDTDPHNAKLLSLALEQKFNLSAPLNTYKREQQLRKAISNGDLKALKRIFDLPLVGQKPTIAFNPLRSLKNEAIIDLTVLSRAAIDSGCNAGKITLIAEGYILAVEKANQESMISNIIKEASIKFCKLVEENKGHQAVLNDELVAAIELYVQQNLQRNFAMEELAQALHFSHDHLMKLYKKLTGRTIMEYARQVRVEAAKELLINAKLSAAEIASLTGFSSQSHFIKVFKAQTGLTPFKFQVLFEGRPFFKGKKS